MPIKTAVFQKKNKCHRQPCLVRKSLYPTAVSENLRGRVWKKVSLLFYDNNFINIRGNMWQPRKLKNCKFKKTDF